jgi:hypothetical protein
MTTSNFENEILNRVRSLNGNQQKEIMDFLNSRNRRHSTRLYKRRAMKQIKEALNNPI